MIISFALNDNNHHHHHYYQCCPILGDLEDEALLSCKGHFGEQVSVAHCVISFIPGKQNDRNRSLFPPGHGADRVDEKADKRLDFASMPLLPNVSVAQPLPLFQVTCFAAWSLCSFGWNFSHGFLRELNGSINCDRAPPSRHL